MPLANLDRSIDLFLETGIPTAGEGAALAKLDAEVLRRLAVDAGFFCDVFAGFDFVVLGQPWLQIRFPTFTTVYDRDRVFRIPGLAGANRTIAAALTTAVVPEEDAQADAGRNARIR